MRNIFLNIVLLLSTFSLNADLFIMDLPPLPDKNQREFLEGETYARSVLDYYKVSVNYEALIKLKGVKPIVDGVTAPTLDQLQSEDFNVIKSYFKIAEQLKKQYEESGFNRRDKAIEELNKQLLDIENKNLELGLKNFQLELANKSVDFYSAQIKALIFELDKKNLICDSLLSAVYFAKKQVYCKMSEEIQKINKNKYPIFTLYSGVQKHYLNPNDPNFENKLGFAGSIAFNPGPILHFGRYFDFRAGYAQYPLTAYDVKYDTQIFEYNIDLIFPISKIFNFNKFATEFKVGLGFFQTTAKADNLSISNTEWYGELVRMELSAFNFGTEFPIGLYLSYSFYHNDNGIMFTTPYSEEYLNNVWTNNFSVGVSFPIWNHVFFR